MKRTIEPSKATAAASTATWVAVCDGERRSRAEVNRSAVLTPLPP
jgi:hypothetical protein